MALPHDGPEIERLRAENRALDEQVKLLVLTEQRLYRSQAELDAQLVRVGHLAGFALATTSLEPADEILRRAVRVLWDAFDLDWAGALVFEDGSPATVAVTASDAADEPPAPLVLEPGDAAWLRDLAQPHFVGLQAAGTEKAAIALVRALAPAAAEEALAGGGLLVLVPVRDMGRERRGLLVTFSVGGRPLLQRPSGSAEQQRPFLQLLAKHLEHAIASSEMAESLRDHRDRLARSLETLESTQQQLVRAQKMDAIGRLAGGVAHDFNNLLTVILGYAGALAASPSMTAPQQENVRRVVEAARRAADITSQLLALGRRQIRRLENLDLSAQAARTAQLLSRLVGEDVAVELTLDRSLPPIRADRAQVEQVLLNLVVNAREAMPQGGRLQIVTRRAVDADAAGAGGAVEPARFAVLEVRDDGVGMDATTRARVFEPFFSTKEGGQGGGLGLAVVYGVVTQSEGHVLVESEPGRGACFTVLLPFANGHAPSPAAAFGNASADEAAAAPAGTVLLVEDEPALREVLSQSLRRAGFTVVAAAHGEEALAALDRMAGPPDLVLSDVKMPRMGGLELADELARRAPAVRVAFMSGYSEDLLASQSSSGRAFLAKPFTPQQLVAFVGAQLAAAR